MQGESCDKEGSVGRDGRRWCVEDRGRESVTHKLRQVQTPTQAPAPGLIQPPRAAQQPPRGRGTARGGNGSRKGQRAPSKGPTLVYTTRHRDDRDDADVIVVTFREFDLILGIDWLVEYRVSLDYAFKRVTLRSNYNTETTMIGERCEAYLAFVSDSGPTKPYTIRDFPDVFPEELLGIPPDREVEFGIELLPSIALASIALYHMEPKELMELKAQL
ncbi:RVP_2 domain-containing protein [Gossypium australe]|uniref:RVP_2 domain-containing protein n=1 Tax=Gossypium australe TaxID=47621 RepID=A0A5B6WJ38_9ROSI|nr:RVP_2 domain-containing protein [Gossypium australe]